MDQDQAREPAIMRALMAVYLVASLLGSLWFLWQMVPEHRRRQYLMTLLRSSGRVTSQLGRRAADRSVALEAITGDPGVPGVQDCHPGVQAYGVPLALGLLGLRIERAYDRARDVTL